MRPAFCPASRPAYRPLQEWREGPPLPELHLPHKNPFIPSDFGLLEVRLAISMQRANGRMLTLSILSRVLGV